MAKIDKSIKRPACNYGLSGSRGAASDIIVNRKSRDSSAPMLVSDKFMDLRPSMCRWPIGDPRHFDARSAVPRARLRRRIARSTTRLRIPQTQTAEDVTQDEFSHASLGRMTMLRAKQRSFAIPPPRRLTVSHALLD
jgi:hypothetical protein